MSRINMLSRYETRRGDATRIESVSNSGVRGYIYDPRTGRWETRTWSAQGIDLEIRELSLVEVKSSPVPLRACHIMELI